MTYVETTFPRMPMTGSQATQAAQRPRSVSWGRTQVVKKLAIVAVVMTCAGLSASPPVAAQQPHGVHPGGEGPTPGDDLVLPPGFIAPQRHAQTKLDRLLPKQPPATLTERARMLGDLYAHLATAEDERSAVRIAASIEQIWLHSGSDTISVLMERALKEANNGKLDLAAKLLDAVVETAPDFAEGWNRRAVIHFMKKDYTRALNDLRQVLALDPNHFKALEGLGQILRDVGQNKNALEAYKQLHSVHPYWAGADKILEELEREVEGQGI